MFSTHSITSKAFKARNAILLSVSIFLGLGSVAVWAVNDISIDTSITNAVQTIMKIIITNNGTQGGTTGLIIDGANGGGVTIFSSMIQDGTATKILGVNGSNKVITTAPTAGINTGAVTGLIAAALNPYLPFPTSYWSSNGANDIYNTNGTTNVNIGASSTANGRLQVETNGSTPSIYLKEATSNGANIVFKDSATTGWMLLGNGSNFYIGTTIGSTTTPYLRVYGNGNIGMGTAVSPIPTQRLEVNGNIKLTSAGRIGATGNNQMYFSTNGSVGVGTGNPGERLDVNGNIKISQAAGGRMGTTGNQIFVNPNGNVSIGTNASSSAKLEVNGNIRLSSKGWIGATGGNQIYLTTGGNVGINTASASETLTVNGDISNKGDIIFKSAGSINYTGKTNQIYLNSNGRVGIGTSGGTEALAVSGNIQINSGNWIGGITNGKIYFTGGRIGIGTNTPKGLLDVNGNMYADNWYQNSDKRLKTDITVMNDALDRILSLNGYYFTWKKNGVKSLGIIAQEIEKVFPEIVSTADDGIKAVSYSNLVAPLIEAVKSLNTKITGLWNLYFDQQQEINQLEQRIEALEKNG